MDQVTRVREVCAHWLAAGAADRAADWILAHRDLAARSGGAGELAGMLDAVAASSASGASARGAAPDDAARARTHALAALRIEIAARAGRFAEASERASAAPGACGPLLHADILAATGDVPGARRMLATVIAAREPSDRARAAAALAELDLLAGRPDDAAAQLAPLLAGDFNSPAVAERRRRGRIGALACRRGRRDRAARARACISPPRAPTNTPAASPRCAPRSRVPTACKTVPPCLEASELTAIIDARRAIGLAREGRLVEAAASLDAAEVVGRELDAVAVADEISIARALVARRRGDSTTAASVLHDLVRARRDRGDELGALRAELELAELELVRGQPSLAAELASAATASSVRRDLAHLAARGTAVIAAIDLLENRIDVALQELTALHGQPTLDASAAANVAVWLATARALAGQRAGAVEIAQSAGAEVRDDIDRRLAGAEVALAAGDVGVALEHARDTAVLAERARRTIELAQALVIVSRLELARGDRASARAAATRAAREAAASGLVRARAGVARVVGAGPR